MSNGGDGAAGVEGGGRVAAAREKKGDWRMADRWKWNWSKGLPARGKE